MWKLGREAAVHSKVHRDSSDESSVYNAFHSEYDLDSSSLTLGQSVNLTAGQVRKGCVAVSSKNDYGKERQDAQCHHQIEEVLTPRASFVRDAVIFGILYRPYVSLYNPLESTIGASSSNSFVNR